MKSPDINVAYENYLRFPAVETYEFFGKELLSYFQSYVRTHKGMFNNEAMAEDAVSDSCIKVIEKLKDYDKDKSSFKRWITVILENSYLDLCKSAVTKAEEPIDPRSGMDYDFEDRMAAKITVRNLINTLNPEDQKLVKLKLEGWEDSEVAERMGVSYDTVTQRWKNLKKKLAQYDTIYLVGNKRVYSPEEIGGGLLSFEHDGEQFVAQPGEWKIIHEAKKV